MRVNNYDSLQAHYHCSAEWHLGQMVYGEGKRAPFAAILYPFAYRVSRNSKLFYGSAERIAEHFGVSPWTVLRAMEALTCAGFFVVVSKAKFQPTIYKVLSHKDWAKAHPGCCAVKTTFPWSGEKSDRLGMHLFTRSGGRVKWYPNVLAGLRKTGLPDDQIVQRFDVFFAQKLNAGHSRWRTLPFKFLKALREDVSPTAIIDAEGKAA